MAKKAESQIERLVTKRAEAAGWIARKFEIEPGDPDHIYFKDGVAMLLEFKKRDAGPNKAQREKIKMFREAGFAVLVVDNLETGYSIFE